MSTENLPYYLPDKTERIHSEFQLQRGLNLSHLLCVKLIQCIEQKMHFRLSLQKEQHLQMAAQPVLANRYKKDKISFPVLGYFWFKLHKVM